MGHCTIGSLVVSSCRKTTYACVLCVLLGGAGCAARLGVTPGPTAVAGVAEGSGRAKAEQDARLIVLGERSKQLTELLVAVEQKLLSASQRLPTAPDDEKPSEQVAMQSADVAPVEGTPLSDDLPEDVVELLERRLIINIALGWVERQILRRRIELGLDQPAAQRRAEALAFESPDRWTQSIALGPSIDPARVDIAALLQLAELELDEARRRRLARGEADRGAWVDVPGQGAFHDGGPDDSALAGLFGAGIGADDGKGGAGVAEPDPSLSPTTPIAKADEKEKRSQKGKRGPARRRAGHGKGGGRRDVASDAVVGKGGLLFAEGGEDEVEEEERSEDASRRASVVAHGAPPAGVMAAVRLQLAPMLGCIPESLRAQGPVRFRVKARLGADGQLHEPVVSSGGLLPPDTVGCLTDLLVRVRVPSAADGASRIIGFPVWLTAPE